MESSEIREKFLKFMESKGHTIIPSASLIPSETDPTVLFTTAGMSPLVPYLLGQDHPGGKRVANAQKCIRTTDIEEVGDSTHHTFFEMLGNWSFGDYFKKESVEWSWEFLTSPEWLNLDKNNLAVSVFAGDQDAPFDEETFNLWKNLGVSEARIAHLPKKNNWWGPAGQTGPCGPDTEIFFWTGKDKAPEKFDPENPLWVEIWNNVFMQFNKTAGGKFEPLAQKNVDTGMGLERILAVMDGVDDNYKTGLFQPIIKKIEKLSRKKYEEDENTKKAFRIVADHIKASAFIIADGVEPSNTGRGYVLRRLVRRAKYYLDTLGAKEEALAILTNPVVAIYKNNYNEIEKKAEEIQKIITDEEITFAGHLMFGMKRLEKIIQTENYISGENAFLLYSTYGFPFELILDISREKNVKIDVNEFEKRKKAHQELSRTASAGMFKGGLADAGEQTVKYHTATHLLLAALRQVLGNHVEQKGSNITAERMRFDFSHSQKMTIEEIKKVEDLVNEKIQENWPVTCEEIGLEEAKAKGATGVFEQKYGEKVKVYTIGSAQGGRAFSSEICGGPHADRTGILGKFKIVKEEASSAGVRRIKAMLE